MSTETSLRKGPDERAVASGGFWLLINAAAGLGVSFITTPFLIRHLGPAGFGVYAVVQSVVAYLGIGDAGMGAASTRFAAGAFEKNDRRGEAAIVWNAAAITFAPSLALAVSFAYFAPRIVHALHVPSALAPQTTMAIAIAVVTILLRNLTGVFNTPQVVRMKYRAITIITVATTVVQGGALVTAVSVGGNLISCFAVLAGSAALLLGLTFFLATRLLPDLAWPIFRRDLLRAMLAYSGSVLIAMVLGLIVPQLDKLFISRNISATAVGYYSVAASLGSAMGFIPRAIKSALFPAASRLDGSADQLRTVYVRSLRILSVVLLPACAAFVLLAPWLLRVWVGGDYSAHSIKPFVALASAATISGLATLSAAVLYGTGRPNTVARVQATSVALYVVLLPLGVVRFGIVGAAVATLVRSIIELVAGLLFTRHLLRDAINRSEALVVVGVVGVLLIAMSVPGPAGIALFGIGVVVYCVVIWNRFLRADERAMLRGLVTARQRK